MQARRTFQHGPQGGWSAIAVHIDPAEPGKEGFYVTLVPDQRPPAVVYLNNAQMNRLLELATNPSSADQQVWDAIAQVPLEPLPPSRSLYGKLRAVLIDFAAAIREQIRLQSERPVPLGEVGDAVEGKPDPGPVLPPGPQGGTTRF